MFKTTTRLRRFAQDFPNPGFADDLAQFCDALKREISDINTDLQWTERLFEPLDAEVEVQGPDGPQRIIADLLTAIRARSTGRLFLVLGEPGSGKSVALRKLTVDLLQDLQSTSRIPLYINLKEWRVPHDYSEDKNISSQHFYDFVYNHLHDRFDILSQRFIENSFLELYKRGHLFFIFDSFDEIPTILDTDEKSDHLRKVSRIVADFIQADSDLQGVVASRYFKRPVLAGRTITTLDIRPFTDNKIRNALERTKRFPAALLDQLFTQRPDLVSISQNPFSAALIAEYVKENGKLPIRQTDLFSDTIALRLQSVGGRVRAAAMTTVDVEKAAVDIAYAMFVKPDLGLDATTSELVGTAPTIDSNNKVEKYTDALSYANPDHS